jgi:hypothetical protein
VLCSDLRNLFSGDPLYVNLHNLFLNSESIWELCSSGLLRCKQC